MKKTLVTGIISQYLSYLPEFLSEKGCEGSSIIRQVLLFTTERIDHLFDTLPANSPFFPQHGNLAYGRALQPVLDFVATGETYNSGAQNQVKVKLRSAGIHRRSCQGSTLREGLGKIYQMDGIAFESSDPVKSGHPYVSTKH
jgi:GDP-D-mannose dehydratase